MNDFVRADSVVRKIWGRADTVLLIFAGASAEFALNKSVDWLYFTGRLPSDPLGRLFSTVEYSRSIIFSAESQALEAIGRIKNIHTAVENARAQTIPDQAYRDVLYMLIYYSVASFELLERKLTDNEKEEIFQTFYCLGKGMNIPALPKNYRAWLPDFHAHQKADLHKGIFTTDLYKQYRRHLGPIRYFLLVELQKVLVSEVVSRLLKFNRSLLMPPMVFVYKIFRNFGIEWFIKSLILPTAYTERIRLLDTDNLNN